NAYLARVLGMDQRAFLASVCAQQKELTAFATMLPSDRRRLVLDLLGGSPVERALAKVREQARDAGGGGGAPRPGGAGGGRGGGRARAPGGGAGRGGGGRRRGRRRDHPG